MATSEESYDINLFTSQCCKAFNTYSGTSIICSQCGRTIGQLPEGKQLSISVRFNEHNTDNVSGDLVAAFKVKAKRFSSDPTYEICSAKCPKCKNYARYARDPQGNLVFICSNPDCRNVFDQYALSKVENKTE